MKIGKIINNNIVSALDEDGSEIIVMGRGIGYGGKSGELIEEEKIEKIFKLDNKDNIERFKELLAGLPLEYIQVSNEIISHAKEALRVKLNQNVYLTLTDHISFAINRQMEGMVFSNALREEIKLFYPNEYTVGKHAVYLIEARIGVLLDEDEAAAIALHLVNAEYNANISTTFRMTKMMREILDIIEAEISLEGVSSYAKDRLVANIKMLACRMVYSQPVLGREDMVLFNFVKEHCTDEYRLSDAVSRYVNSHYDCTMTEEERIYLALNVKRMKDLERD